MVCDRYDQRLAENYLSMYETLKDEFEEAEKDIIYAQHIPDVRAGKCGQHISDKTCNRALKLVDLYESDAYIWFKAMELLHNEFNKDTDYNYFLILKYRNAQELSYEEIAEEMHVSRKTVFNIRERVIYYLVYKYYQLKARAAS